MPTLIYIHGFLSSPHSEKAVQVRDWLAINRPDISYVCPFLTPYFGETRLNLEDIVKKHLPNPVYLVGSSLGGYWATYLVEKYDLRAVLINPLVKPEVLGENYIGIELKNYHTDDMYVLDERHIKELFDANIPVIQRCNNYWLMVQTGDETLNYKFAVKKYKGCRCLVESGGNHSFQGFKDKIPQIINFLEDC